MKTTFDQVIGLVLAHEGGFDCDPRDSGNWTGGRVRVGFLKGTKYGIDCASYPNLDIESLTVDDAKAIYKKDYWDTVNGDQLPAGLDYSVFDFGINSGVSRASRYLQQIVGSPPDGIIGEHTLACVELMDPQTIIEMYNARRLEFLQNAPGFGIYGNGWTTRVNDVRAKSLELWKGSVQHGQS